MSFGFGDAIFSRRVSISVCVASASSVISSTSLQWGGRDPPASILRLRNLAGYIGQDRFEVANEGGEFA